MQVLRRGRVGPVCATQVAKSVVKSAAYRGLASEAPEETLLFRRWAMICLAAGDKEEAAKATLQGAWAADDGVNMVEAAKCVVTSRRCGATRRT
jgi:hypothetical protein